ncbi:MAG: carboxypeptidase regulatory-like domain-containing protein [bacterium]
MRKYLFYSISTAILLSVVVSGCGQQTAQVQQNNSSPVGSITGTIFDINTNVPLQNAKAYVLVNGNYQVATSNAQGVYTLSNLPLGAVYTVTYTANGYATPIYNVDLTNNTSQFPQGNALVQQNVGMFLAAATVSGTVYNGLNGANGGCPASTVGLQGAHVVMDFRSIAVGVPGAGNFVGFDLVASATTNTNGGFTISNLPASGGGNFYGARPFILVYYIDSNQNYYYDTTGFINLYPNAITQGISVCLQ